MQCELEKSETIQKSNSERNNMTAYYAVPIYPSDFLFANNVASWIGVTWFFGK